jgi:hypothetical protein
MRRSRKVVEISLLKLDSLEFKVLQFIVINRESRQKSAGRCLLYRL